MQRKGALILEVDKSERNTGKEEEQERAVSQYRAEEAVSVAMLLPFLAAKTLREC
ncbi:MAG: hypothetical protein M3Z08_14590 [Chloroflexota bacterium]|nr:hypothetical protein [Chloroflexota bacterium]